MTTRNTEQEDYTGDSGYYSVLMLLVGAAIVLSLIFGGSKGAAPVDYGTGNTINSYNSYSYQDNDTSIDVCIGACR